MPAPFAVCALVEQTGMSFEEAAGTSLYWLSYWRAWCQLTRPERDPA